MPVFVKLCTRSCPMEQCPTRTSCVTLCSFRRIRSWVGYTGFAYDGITDAEIISSMQYVSMCNIHVEWQDDRKLSENNIIPTALKHAVRVAALVNEYVEGKGFHPITIDTYSMRPGTSGVSDGNHRIRALQFLKIPWFPASFSGDVEVLRKISVKSNVVKLIAV